MDADAALAIAALGPDSLRPSSSTKSASRQLERQLEALEARLLSVISAHQLQTTAALREADKLADHAAKTVEMRLNGLEQRQARFELQLAELAAVVKELREEPRPLPQEACHAQPPPSCTQAEAARGLPDPFGLGRGAQRAVPPASAEPAERAGLLGASDTVLLAVQELESILRTEVKAINKRCDLLQDTLDEHALLPLRDFERRLQDQEQMARQLSGAVQDCSSCVEEHEFRLGVARTKLDVHERKLSRLEGMRWTRGPSGSPTEPDRTSEWGSSGGPAGMSGNVGSPHSGLGAGIGSQHAGFGPGVGCGSEATGIGGVGGAGGFGRSAWR